MYKIGNRVRHKYKGLGTIVKLKLYDSSTHDVRYDNRVGNIGSEREFLWYSDEGNLTLMEETVMNVGTFVKDSNFGIGKITEMNVGSCSNYIRAKFESGEHRVKARDVTPLDCSPRPTVGDHVFAIDDSYNEYGTIVQDDYDDAPYHIKLDVSDITDVFTESEVTFVETPVKRKFNIDDTVKYTNRMYSSAHNGDVGEVIENNVIDSKQNYNIRFSHDSTWYAREDELESYVKPKFNVGDMVVSTSKFCGKPFVATVLEAGTNASYVTLQRRTRVNNDCMTLAEPKFNIGDTIQNGRGDTVHTITGVRPSRDREHICYDTKLDYGGTGTAYNDESFLYDEVSDVRAALTKQRTELIKLFSTHDCNKIGCMECPLGTKGIGCAYNDVRSIIDKLNKLE